jgi:hypothetical protein
LALMTLLAHILSRPGNQRRGRVRQTVGTAARPANRFSRTQPKTTAVADN